MTFTKSKKKQQDDSCWADFYNQQQWDGDLGIQSSQQLPW